MEQRRSLWETCPDIRRLNCLVLSNIVARILSPKFRASLFPFFLIFHMSTVEYFR